MKKFVFIAILLFLPAVLFAESDCEKAAELVIQAYDMGKSSYSAQKELLGQALRLCPDHPEAHNNLASILEEEKDYESALQHYQQALSARPDFPEAWYGMGEVYAKTGKSMLALESYMKGSKDPDARRKAGEIIRSEKYRFIESGEIADARSLKILFDKNRRKEFQKNIRQFNGKAIAEPEFIFRNIRFDTGSAALKSESLEQIQEIAGALREIGSSTIIISGHTDRQPFKGHTQAESDRLNMRLSEDRAASVAKALAERGVSADNIKSSGYGPTEPIDKADTQEAYAKNRRVVIEVRE